MTLNFKPIQTQSQYKMVASRIEQLQDAPPQSAEAQELKLLTRLIVTYEKSKSAISSR